MLPINKQGFFSGYLHKEASLENALKDIKAAGQEAVTPEQNIGDKTLSQLGYVDKDSARTTQALSTILGATAAGAGMGAILSPKQRGSIASGRGILNGTVGGAAIGTGIAAYQNRDRIKAWLKDLMGG